MKSFLTKQRRRSSTFDLPITPRNSEYTSQNGFDSLFVSLDLNA
jgi:hypothetical protein